MEPVYQRLAASIRDSIVSGELAPGDRLPSELTLAGRAGVSRPTVREALRVLQESGFIERASPRIFVVRDHNAAPAAQAVAHALRRRTVTFSALHEALMLFEPELTRLAALRRDNEDLAALRANLDEQQAHLRDYRRWCRLDEEFHVAIAEAGGNAPLVLTRATLGLVLVPTVAQFVTTERATHAGTNFHQRIYDAIAEGDPDLAALVARRHVEDFRRAWEHSGLEYGRDISQLIGETTARLNE
jgi:GntR family transcriptional repressor for pyruvate dehydrogenase complex